MILIAESGSTKTDWLWTSPHGKTQTVGINPYFLDIQQISQILRQDLLNLLPQMPQKVFFYGTGCLNPQKANIVKSALQNIFGQINIEVYPDILAAARALCQTEAGVVAILGTGSNACFYDGQKISRQSLNLGYLLGDEGSGADLGKQLLQDFFYGKMPAHIAQVFAQNYDLERHHVMEKIYSEPFANRYLAHFARFLLQFSTQEYVLALVEKRFELFFEHHIIRIPESEKYPIHFVGSVAFYFQDILQKIAQKQDIKLKNIIQNPINDLLVYHKKADK